MKKVIIIGAGPAGLTAGYELLRKSSDYDVTIIEESSNVGGLCARIEHNDKILDAGGHMFISNNSQVKEFWNMFLPAQGVPSCDDLFLDRYCKISNGGPDPEKTDKVMLSREKVTRVYNEGKFYESPFRLNKDNIKSFGVGNSIKSGFSQIGGSVFKKKEKSLEEYYVNRYGSKLYCMFLDSYTEKVIGKNPNNISAAFGPVSERDIITPNISVDKNDGKDLEKATPPFANRYYYPKKGVAQMWENVADRFIEKGGSIHRNCKVLKIHTEGNIITGITCIADGESFEVACDMLISSMPVKDFIKGLESEVPYNVNEVLHGINYRGLVTIGVELLDMGLKNDTDEQTINNILPDSFIYINDNSVKLGRIQVFNNFSPYMVGNDNHIWLGLNYYCNEGDYYWSLNDQAWKQLAIGDLKKLGIIKDSSEVLDYVKASFSKAFPGYYDSFDRFDEIRKYLDGFENLYCIGRNGQHNFITMEQSMLTSFETVNCVLSGVKSRETIWNAPYYVEHTEEVNVNSALLSSESDYRNNAVPIQRMDTLMALNDSAERESKEPISIKRMRRPMMTPIKKAEPVLDENGEQVNVNALLNDYNLIGAPSFRRSPVEEKEAEPEEQNTSKEKKTVGSIFNVIKSIKSDSRNSSDENEQLSNLKEEINNSMGNGTSNDDRVVLKNSVIIAQRPERTIPIDDPNAEENNSYGSNMNGSFYTAAPYSSPVNDVHEVVADNSVEDSVSYAVNASELKEETPEPVVCDSFDTLGVSLANYENTAVEDNADTQFAPVETSVDSDTQSVESSAEIKANYNDTEQTVSMTKAARDLEFEKIMSSIIDQTDDDFSMGVEPKKETKNITVKEEINENISSESAAIDDSSSEKPDNILNFPILSENNDSEEDADQKFRKQMSIVSDHHKGDALEGIVHEFKNVIVDVPQTDNIPQSSNVIVNDFTQELNNISAIREKQEATVTDKLPETVVPEKHPESNKYTISSFYDFGNTTKSSFDVLHTNNSDFNILDDFDDMDETEKKDENTTFNIVKNDSFSFAKADRFAEKDNNVENLKVIEKSNSGVDTSNMFAKVDTFEQKELIEETERVVKSHHYVDLDKLSDDMFSKADRFNENVLISETENVIPRPVATSDSSVGQNSASVPEDTTNSVDTSYEAFNNDAVVEADLSSRVIKEETKIEEKKDSVSYGSSLYGKKTSFVSSSSLTTEIDPSVVFKNAKVIKSTKITKPAEEISKPVVNPNRSGWLNSIAEMGGKEKVIAKYVNGEEVKIEKEKPATKKTKTKKTVKEDDADIVQPPISVVWEGGSKESSIENQALQSPKRRGRKSKVSKENNLKND